MSTPWYKGGKRKKAKLHITSQNENSFKGEFFIYCFNSQLSKEEGRIRQSEILKFITLLRKVSNHAALLLPYHKASEQQQKVVTKYIYFKTNDGDISQLKSGAWANQSEQIFCEQDLSGTG